MRSSAVIDKEPHMEAEEIQDDAEHPALAEDAEVRIDYEGSTLTARMKKGEGKREQARHVHYVLKQTLVCSPLEKSGDTYVIGARKPTTFPVRFRRNGEVSMSWVNHVYRKTSEREAKRIFGKGVRIQGTTEPGLVYEVVDKKTAGPKRGKKKEPAMKTRDTDFPGNGGASAPVSCRDMRIPVEGGMEQRSAKGMTETVGMGNWTMHVIFPGISATKKGIVTDRSFTREPILEVATKWFNLKPIRQEYVEIAPEDWAEEDEITVRFMYDRPVLDTMNQITLEQLRARFDLIIPAHLE
jgi:hypothetical protein